MEDAYEIAESLTKARRTALWNLGCRGNEWQLAPHDGWRRAGNACAGLVKIGLAEKAPPGTRFSDAPAYRLNERGLAVRAHLQSLLANKEPTNA